MIELDEIQEPQKSNYTPIAILGVVAVLLVIVAFIGYKDYIDSNAEKKLSDFKYEKDREMEQLKLQVQELATLKDATKRDPALSKINQELEALKASTKLNRDLLNKFDQELSQASSTENTLFGPLPNLTPTTNPTSTPLNYGEENSFPRPATTSAQYTDRPPSLNRASATKPPISGPHSEEHRLFGPPPTALGNIEELALNEAILNAAPSAPLTAQEKNILSANAIAEVVSYDGGLVTINGGDSNNIRKGQRFQISRGTELLGQIEVEKTFRNESVASFLNTGAAVVPQKGDKVIIPSF